MLCILIIIVGIIRSTLIKFPWKIEKISVLFYKKKLPYFGLFLSNFFTFIHYKSEMTQIVSLVFFNVIDNLPIKF